MEVIKHGKWFGNRIDITCDDCDCMMRVERDDIMYYLNLGNMCMHSSYTKYIKCPECGKKIELSKKELDTLGYKGM